MDWKDVDTTHCGIAACAELMGDFWSILLLRDILSGVTKFKDLQVHTGVSTAVLSKRLKALVDTGILEANEYREPGQRARTEYALTLKGLDLAPVIAAMGQFGSDHIIAPKDRLVEYLDGETHQKVHVGMMREDGKEIDITEVQFRVTPKAYSPGYEAPPSRERRKS